MTQEKQDSDLNLEAEFESEGTLYRGHVTRVADGSICMGCAVGSTRALPLPEQVRLKLSGANLAEELGLEAKLRQWTRDGEQELVRLDIRPDQFSILEAAVHPERSERTPVRGSKAIRILVQPMEGEQQVTAALIDLSDTGLALILSQKDDMQLAQAESGTENPGPWNVRLSLQLPGKESALHCVGEIRYRMFTRKCIKYGIHFHEELSQATYPEEKLSIQEHVEWFRQSDRTAA